MSNRHYRTRDKHPTLCQSQSCLVGAGTSSPVFIEGFSDPMDSATPSQPVWHCALFCHVPPAVISFLLFLLHDFCSLWPPWLHPFCHLMHFSLLKSPLFIFKHLFVFIPRVDLQRSVHVCACASTHTHKQKFTLVVHPSNGHNSQSWLIQS